MIKLENVNVVGLEPAIRGMRNPMNSWEKSDSKKGCNGRICAECNFKPDWCGNAANYTIGPNDLGLMKRLTSGGPVHAKYRRMIVVYVDITAPLYWWKEFDTYKIGTVANSCSTMHKIHAKPFELDDFSHEHLFPTSITALEEVIIKLNAARDIYVDGLKETKDTLGVEVNNKSWWWQMIQLLPSSYNQRRTVMLSYKVLANIYKWRKNHKLNEWRTFCDWIESLPYSHDIIFSDDTAGLNWIEERTNIVCPKCSAAFDYEIVYMSKDEWGLPDHCPHCGIKLGEVPKND